MKKPGLLTVFLALMFAAEASAVNFLKPTSSTSVSLTIPYVSVDAQNKPVVLSEYISIPASDTKSDSPSYHEIQFIVLNNHGTLTDNEQAPSGGDPMDAIDYLAPDGAMAMMTSEDALVIMPDYLGYGYTKDRRHPYINQMLTARNVLDGFVAALDTVKARGISISPDYYTYNIGYSQGGAVTMAVQCYLEKYASQELRDLFRLKKSIAGAGPYDLHYIFDDLCTQDKLSYPVSLPLTLEGLYEAYREGCMKTCDIDKMYISKDLRDYAVHLLDRKDVRTLAYGDSLYVYLGKNELSMKDLFNEDVILGDTPEHKALVKALEKNNLLDGSWIPETPMILYHYTDDEVVQYGNSEEAVRMFGDKVTLYTEEDNLKSHLDWYIRWALSSYMNPKTHSDNGTLFYIYILGGVLR